jgi:hypothetical protein
MIYRQSPFPPVLLVAFGAVVDRFNDGITRDRDQSGRGSLRLVIGARRVAIAGSGVIMGGASDG